MTQIFSKLHPFDHPFDHNKEMVILRGGGFALEKWLNHWANGSKSLTCGESICT